MEKSAIMMMHSPQKSVDQQMNNIGNVTQDQDPNTTFMMMKQ